MNARIAALLFLGFLVPNLARAQDAPTTSLSPEAEREGREHFARGLSLYREGNFSAARIEFQRAYDVGPSYRILFNLGQTDYDLQDYAGALVAFKRYLAEGGTHVPSDRRAEVGKALGNLEQRVARITIKANVDGADIAIDGVRVGTTPLAEPILVSVGRRTVTATLGGRIPATKTIDLAAADRVPVQLELLEPEVAPPIVATPEPSHLVVPPPTYTPREEPAKPRSTAPIWFGVTVTGALAATATVFGVLTLNANGSLNGTLAQFPGSSSAIDSARTRVHTDALLTDIFGGAAIVGAGVTCYLVLSRPGSSSRTQLALGPTHAGFQLSF